MAERALPVSKQASTLNLSCGLSPASPPSRCMGLILSLVSFGGLIVSAQERANFGDVIYWAFFPNMARNPIGVIWMTVLAKLMVIAFVLSACTHGVHGVLEIFDDYVDNKGARRWARNIVIMYAIVACLIAIYIIWTR